MRRLEAFTIAGSLLVSACAGNKTAVGSAQGAAIGAGIGSVAGGLGGRTPAATAAGAAIGALVGGAAGAIISKRQRREYHRDPRGYCYYVNSDGRTIYDAKAHC